jgi:trimeric autotransporter adhesin
MPQIILRFFILLFFSCSVYDESLAQCNVTPPPAVTIPCGGSTTLNGFQPAGNFALTTTACAPLPTGGTNAFAAPVDDAVTGQIPIGFPFAFFGNTYNTAVISSNGLVAFGPFTYNGYASFALPTTTINNFIAGFYADINIVLGGTITYQTIGTSPNQQFVVSYTNVQAFGGGGGTASFQIVLNQNGGFQIIISQLSANWNVTTLGGPLGTSGAQNSNGTIAIPVPGRNATDWPGIIPSQQDCATFGALVCNFQSWQVAGTTVSNAVNYTVSPVATTTYTGVWNCNGTTCTANTTVTVPPSPLVTNESICAGATPSITASSCGTPGTNFNQNTPFNSGALTATDPKWNRNGGGTACTASAGTTYYYDVYPFTVSTAGSYTFDGCFPTADGYGSLFQNAFNGATPCAVASNHIFSNDDSNPNCASDPRITATLTPGITYYIISTTWAANALGAYSWNFTGPAGATINSGGTGSTLQWYTAATGGTSISSVSPFDPTGIAGSGLPNTNTAGVYNYYAACSAYPTCRSLATITISAPTVLPTSIAGTGNICAGATATLSLVGGTLAAGASWEWFTGSCGGTVVGTGTSITVTPTITTTYYVRATAGTGCPASTCVSGTVTVNPVPVITATPANQTLCSGTTIGIALSSVPVGSTFDWTVSQIGVTGASNGSGNNIAQVLNCSGTTSGTATYTITPTLGICVGTAVNIPITVNPVPVAVATPVSETICSGETSSIALSSIVGTTFSWTVAQVGVTGASNGTGAAIAQTLSSTTGTIAGTATYTITPTLGTCAGIPIVVNINVNQVPTAVSTPTTQTFCSGSATAIALSSIAGTTFDWTVAQVGVTGALAGSGSTISQTLTSAGSVQGTATYSITPTLGACVGVPISVAINVNPSPTLLTTPTSQTLCSGLTTGIALSSIPGTTFAWTVAQNGVSGASNGSGSSISQTLTSTGTTAGAAAYTITPTLNACIGATGTVTITINPVPVVLSTPSSQTFCSGNTTAITLSSIVGTTFAWTSAASNVTGGSTGSGTSIAQILTNPSTTSGTNTYTVTPTLGTCVGAQTSVIVTVNPLPTITVNAATFCAGANALLTATGAATYSWSPVTNLSSATGASVTAGPSNTTTYNVTGTSLVGCTSTASSLVTVKPNPVVVLSNNGPLCFGDALNITATTTNIGVTYAWTGPVAFSSAVQNPSIASVDYPNAGIYTLTSTLNGCSSTTTSNVIINTGTSTAINPVASICSNSSSFNVTSLNPGGVWSGTAISSTGIFDPSLAVIGTNTITYSIAGACASPSTATITMLQAPTVSFSADKIAGCGPLKVALTDNSTPVGATQSWTFGNGTYGSGSTTNTTYLTPGCNTVTLTSTSANGCFGSQTINDYICVYQNPDVSLASNVSEVSINEPNFEFINNSTGAVAYLWDFGDATVTSILVNPTHTYENGGSYLVTLLGVNADGCKDSANIIVRVIDEISFYIPNSFTPNEDEYNNLFTPTLTPGFDPSEFLFSIYNRWGQLIYESKDVKVGWDGSFNGKIVQDGIYTWRIQYKAKDNDKRFLEYGAVTLFR